MDSTNNPKVYLLASDSAQQFLPVVHSLPPTYNSLVCWADMNLDGWDDLLYGGEMGQGVLRLAAYTNNAGTLVPTQSLSGAAHGCIEAADFDQDGDVGFFVSAFDIGKGRSSHFLENNGGVLQERIDPLFEGMEGGNAAAGDMDGDGDLDLVVCGIGSAGYGLMAIYENLGGWNFGRQDLVQYNTSLGSAKWSDFDHDGDLDLAVCGAMPYLKSCILENSGMGFSDTGFAIDSVHLGQIIWVDFDLDGWDDLVLSGLGRSGPVTNAYRNLAGAGFTPAQPSFPLPGLYNSTLSFADYDSDGYPDIIATGLDSLHHNRSIIFQYFPGNNPARYGN